MTPDLDALERAAWAVTKGDLATAEIMEDGTRPCPCCDGEGYVDGRDYINVDSVPLNVQFSGIGPEFGRWEAYFQATQPAAILALIARVRAAEAALGEARGPVLPENLSEIIGLEMLLWRGSNGGIFSIHACAIAVADTIRAWLSQNPLERGGWQDFSTAPEDGSVILVFRPDAGVFTAHFVEEDAHLSSPERPPEGDEFWFSTCGEDLTGDLPTHWRPLPAPPQNPAPATKNEGSV